MNIEGKLYAKFETQNITDSFKKREFVVEFVENPLYPQYIKFECIQDRTAIVDAVNEGDKVEVSFNLRGREWTNPQGEKKYFTTLDAWRVQKVEAPAAVAAGGDQPVYDVADIPGGEDDDLPF